MQDEKREKREEKERKKRGKKRGKGESWRGLKRKG